MSRRINGCYEPDGICTVEEESDRRSRTTLRFRLSLLPPTPCAAMLSKLIVNNFLPWGRGEGDKFQTKPRLASAFNYRPPPPLRVERNFVQSTIMFPLKNFFYPESGRDIYRVNSEQLISPEEWKDLFF